MTRTHSPGPATLDALFFGPLEARIAAARVLEERLPDALLRDPGLRPALRSLADLLDAADAVMASLQLGPSCAECGAGPGGGCCSAMMASEVDGPLLLTNALLGREIPPLRPDDWECGFLGPGGCTLRPKPLFCLRYLCAPLREALTGAERDRLERATDALQWQQTAVEARLLAWLRRASVHLPVPRG